MAGKTKLSMTAKISMPLWAYTCMSIVAACYGALGYHYGLIGKDGRGIDLLWAAGIGAMVMPFLVAILLRKKRGSAVKAEPYSAANKWGENKEE